MDKKYLIVVRYRDCGTTEYFNFIHTPTKREIKAGAPSLAEIKNTIGNSKVYKAGLIANFGTIITIQKVID